MNSETIGVCLTKRLVRKRRTVRSRFGERGLVWFDEYIRGARPELLVTSDDGPVLVSSQGKSMDRACLTGLGRSHLRRAKTGKFRQTRAAPTL